MICGSVSGRLEGELRADRLAREPLVIEEALRYGVDIGSALHRAHAGGLVHGRLSSLCILIAGTRARIVKPPQAWDVRWAPYRSPEQVRGEATDSRSDIFSYGAVLYEMATGRRAFAEAGEALNREIIESSPAALQGRSPVHLAMENVLAGCLAKDPAARRQRIQNAVIELKLAARSVPPGAAKGHELPLQRRSLAAPEAKAELVPSGESLTGQVTQPIFRFPQNAAGPSGRGSPLWMGGFGDWDCHDRARRHGLFGCFPVPGGQHPWNCPTPPPSRW